MRLFIAIRLSDEMRKAIVDVQDAMIRQGMHGNYTTMENLHLTLVFIGEYSDPDYVLEVMDTVTFTPVELKLNGMGAFGDLWWISGVRLRHAMAEAGIPFDSKRFMPHITILRRASVDLSKVHLASVKGVKMLSDHVSLMRSDRGKAGMIYTEII